MHCKYFKVWELVPKAYYENHDEHKLWWLFDDRLLLTLDMLHDQYGRIIINNWRAGGQYNESGFRPFSTATGALFSQHKYGRAADCKFLDSPTFVVRQDCIDMRYECFKYITAIELGVAWFHFDVRCLDNDGKLMTFTKT